jgi:hypothetical protein
VGGLADMQQNNPDLPNGRCHYCQIKKEANPEGFASFLHKLFGASSGNAIWYGVCFFELT